MRLFDNPNSTAGKMTVSIMIVGFAVFALAFLFDFESERAEHIARAQESATTTVTVLNTPPLWTVNAQENPESSTSSPTNATSSVSWIGTGTDSNGEDYFLLICDSAAAATPNSLAPPTCAGGTWAVSPTTTSGTQATSTYTTLTSDAEVNDWYASICDSATTTPACNVDIQQGSGSTASPFHVNHRPVFDVISNDSPGDPGVLITWTSSSSDQDSLSGDGVVLHVCNTTDFDFAVPECGGGASGTWATSSHVFTSNALATTTIVIPTQDDTYAAYVTVVDNHGFAALNQAGAASNSPLIVNNVAPTVSASSITLNYGDDIILTTEQGETTGFSVEFTFTDNNSCVANGSSTSEFNASMISVFRTGVGSTSCDTAGEFDANNCYNTAARTDLWAFTDPDASGTSTNTCTGPTDTTQAFELRFPLWYIAEPTDGSTLTDSTWFNESWTAAVQVSDDDLASSTNATSSSDVELISFLAFDLNTFTIPYGSIAPGNTTTPISATTTIEATGNVGIDEGLDGEHMCTDYTVFDSCFDPSPVQPTSTIVVEQQVYATSSVAYSDPLTTQLSSTSVELEINVPKTTVTTTPATGDTIWGIAIPASITLSGSYTGQNTFTVIKGEAEDW